MSQARYNTPLLRRFSTAAVIATLALASGCFTSDGGRVGEMVTQRMAPDAGVAAVFEELGVMVDQQGTSLVFDFSDVAEPGSLSTLDAAHQVSTEHLGTVWGALVDTQSSDADPGAVVLQLDRHGLLVSFDGLAYDQNTFIKIDFDLGSAG